MRLPKIRYSWSKFAGDMSGGVIAALIALPYGLAMAALMGLPPVLGLFTSLLTSPITGTLGRNPLLIGGTSTVTVPFVALAVKHQGIGGAAKVTLVASVFMMIFSVLRLGRYISKVPTPVVSGFSCGIGGMMVLSQVRPMLFGAEPQWQALTMVAIVVTLATLVARIIPRAPAPLIAVALAVVAAQTFGLHDKEVGFVSLALPPFAGFAWSPSDVFTVLPSALGLAFVSSVNILLTSRVVEHFRGWHRPLKKQDADAELGAYGIANVCAGVFGAPMSVGIPARSLAAVRCGATTRMANLFHAGILAAMVGLGADVLARIPMAALAGVTAWMGFCLLDWSTWRRLHLMKKVDAFAFLSTALSVLFINAVAAVLIGSSMYLIQRWYRRISVAPPDRQQVPA